MPRFAANLSLMFTERPFLERFAAAQAAGFAAVEFQFGYEHGLARVRNALDASGLRLVLLNAPAGDWAAGERGLAALPGRQAAFRAGLDEALDWASALGKVQDGVEGGAHGHPRVHVMAGCPGADVSHASAQAVYLDNLAHAVRQAEARGVTLTIEPINTRDMPGYFLTHQAQAHAIVREVGSTHLQVQMDLYHCQIMEGDLTQRLREWIPTGRVGHMQVAGVPARQEPDEGELNLDHLMRELDALGYTGWVGAEYRPRGRTEEGLGWLARF
ncbi:hydroxypyruvate isomerase [beta proteobacterium AAP99]|nr:hydroxypyruvate isomerase [beta proteobacterium AAP99]